MSATQMTTDRNNSIRGIDLLQRKAETLRSLHRCGRILVLPNAWDAASAKVFEKAGFPAIATTSAGIAASMGYADGQRIPRQQMLDTVARIARAVDVPVTADLEAGYATTAEEMRETTERLLETGAVGLNLLRHETTSRRRRVFPSGCATSGARRAARPFRPAGNAPRSSGSWCRRNRCSRRNAPPQ